jgi:hypothetical protein
MAAKKKHKKVAGHRPKHRRGRVGAMKPGSMEHYLLLGVGAVLGGIGGAFAASMVGQALPAQVTQSAPWLPGAGIAGAGIIPVLAAPDHPVALGLGIGMLAIGGTIAANNIINIPGIAGMSMNSNAPAGSPTIRTSIGQGPKNYINQTVGYMSRRQRAMGAVVSN